jgi:tetracycline resistance efflux pump
MFDWLVVVPPILLLITAFLTHNILLSLLIGIASAGIIGAHFSLINTATIIVDYVKHTLIDPDMPYMFGFLFILGAIIVLIMHTGGSCAFSDIIKKRIRSARASESMSLGISLLLCIDDYFNALTTGCIMHPLTDKFHIPRAKLAYLIDVMASPIVVLIPVSSWIAFIVKQLGSAGVRLGFTKFVQQEFNFPGGSLRIAQNIIVQADPFYTYIKAIPFMFYSFIAILTAWFIVRNRISYGPMAEHERIARTTGNLYGGKKPRFKLTQPQDTCEKTYLSDFLAPILSLIAFTLIGLPYSGGYYVFGGTHAFVESIRNVNIFPVLFFASILSLTCGFILAFIRRKNFAQHIPTLLAQGIYLMYQSAIIVFSALVFSNMLKFELHTGTYIAQLVLPYIQICWLPFIIFAISLLISLGTGSSWGTIAIMIPISLPMLRSFYEANGPIPLHDIYILLPTIGAIISGALAGAQLSPISDPVTMASISAGTYQIDHVKTQTWYLIPAIVGTSIAFIMSGYITEDGSLLASLLCITTGLIISLGITQTFHLLYKTKKS